MANLPPQQPSRLVEDVARGVYANNTEMFQRDLNSAIQGAVSRVCNVNGWAQDQLRIMVEMAEDRGIQWVANEANRIREGLKKP